MTLPENTPSPRPPRPPDDIVERIFTLVAPAPPVELVLPSGRRVAVEPGEGLVVRAPDGALELAVRFSRAGAVFTVAGAALVVESAGDLRLRARGAIELEGASVAIRARAGDATLAARDDVRVEGERVLLNC